MVGNQKQRLALKLVAIGVVLAVAGGLGWKYGHELLQRWRAAPSAAAASDARESQAARLRLSPQARAHLALVVKPLQLSSYQQAVVVPGRVVERFVGSDYLIPAPVAGVAERIHVQPGQEIRPGQQLVTLRPTSEAMQTAQAQLYRTRREMDINQEEQARLTGTAGGESLFRARLIELGYEYRRLRAAHDALQHELSLRGLSAAQIEQVAQGRFVSTLTVEAPAQASRYEVEALRVELGEQVQVGQTLCVLADHSLLHVQGQVYEAELAYLHTALRGDKRLVVEFPFVKDAEDRPLTAVLPICHVGHRIDATHRTLVFHLALDNRRSETNQHTDQDTHAHWRFRPGQMVRIRLPVRHWHDVFVLPRDAVVREGAEYYVFRANGELFERVAVTRLFEDHRFVVLANDGSLTAGQHVAHNAAPALQRAWKAMHSSDAEHDHDHDH
ncbi:MAG: hypothetical protein C4297_07875 [Gemmataceae bacterium]